MILSIILLVAGLVLLIFGSDYLVKGACVIANRLQVPPLIVGLTVVAFGTSAPELFVSTSSALKGNADFAIGNIVGSNIFNMFGIVAFASLISVVKFNGQVLKQDVPVMLVALGSFYYFAANGEVSRLEGGILFAGILLYLLFLYLNFKKSKSADPDKEMLEELPAADWGILLSFVVILASLFAMVIGSNLVVDNGSIIAKSLGVSDFVISVTLVGIGTSLPELATTYSSAKQGQADLALGNAVGSNIFNVFMVIGLTALIAPLTVSEEVVAFDLPVMFFAVFLLWPLMILRKEFAKVEGVSMFLAYAVYVYFLIHLGAV